MARPHGLKGEVIVSLSTNRDERLAPGSVLTPHDGTNAPRGARQPAPGAVHRDFRRFVPGIDEAEELRGTELLAAPLEDSAELWVHELIGSTRRGP